MNALTDTPTDVAAAPRVWFSKGGAVVTVVALSAIALPWVAGSFGMSLAISGALLALAAMPLTVLTGTAGLLSLGQAAFLGIGGYCAGFLAYRFGLGLTLAIPAAAILGLGVGALVALVTWRVAGLYLAVGTFTLQVLLQPMLQNIDVAVTDSTGFILRDPSLFGIALDSPARWWYALILFGTLIYAWLAWLQRTQVGRVWVVLRDVPTAASVLGISRARARLGVFAMTSALTAGAGALGAYYYGTAQSGAYTLHQAILLLTIVALGGAGSLAGAVLAAFFMTLLSPAAGWLLEHATGWLDTSRAGGVETVLVGFVLMVSLIVRARRAEEAGHE